MDLKQIREKIDKIDREILDLLKERFSFLPEIAEYKKENNLPIQDKNRENEVLKDRVERGKNRGLSADFVRELFEIIIVEARKIQNEK